MLYDSIQLFEGSKLINVVVDSGTSFPANANAGELFYRTTNNTLYIYSGTEWTEIGAGGGGASLPSQTGNSGQFLTTDGTSASWATVLPSQTGNSGQFLSTNGTSASWTAVFPSQTGNSGQFLTTNGTAVSWSSLVTVASLTGNSGKYLTTDGTTTSWSIVPSGDATALSGVVPLANGGTGLSAIPGSSGQLIMNSSGAYAAASRISYNGTSTLTVGSSGTAFTIVGSTAPSIGTDASDVTIRAGSSANSVAVSGGRSGHLTLAGGDGNPTGGAGGDLILRGGTGPHYAGTVYIKTGDSETERLRITPAGAWGLGGANYGTSGQVLTSNGSGSAPTWSNAGAGTVSSVGVSSSGTYSAALTIGSSPVTSSGTITITPNLFGSSAAGVVPASGGGTTNFLRADGTWAATSGASSSSTNTWTATQTFSGSTNNPSVAFGNSYTETQGTVTAASTTTIDCSVANNFTVSLAASITTLSFTNVPSSGRNYSVSLFLRQDATGGKTVTWPGTVRWPGGSAPVLTSTANKTDVISLVTYDGGTTWLAFVAGQNF